MIDSETRLRPNDDEIAARVIEGEAIIINLATGSYYSMSGPGGLIWAAIERRCSIEEMAAEIYAAYDVSLDQARTDLLELADELLRSGLVNLSTDSKALADASPAPSSRSTYTKPMLAAYDDMRNLLALDPPTPLFGRMPANEP